MSKFILAKQVGFQQFIFVSDIFSNCVNYALSDSGVKTFSEMDIKKYSKLINRLKLKCLKQGEF